MKNPTRIVARPTCLFAQRGFFLASVVAAALFLPLIRGQILPPNTPNAGAPLPPAELIYDLLRAEKARLFFGSGAFVTNKSGQKVIYGVDDRREIGSLPSDDPTKRSAA